MNIHCGALMNLKQQYQTSLITDALLHSLQTHSVCTTPSETIDSALNSDGMDRQWMSFFYLPKLNSTTANKIKSILSSFTEVGYIEIDQQTHHLAIYHDGPITSIEKNLEKQGIDVVFQQTQANYIPEPIDWKQIKKRHQILSWLFSINLIMLMVTFFTGLIASSTALIALALIIMSDVMIYAMTLYGIHEKQIGLYKFTRVGLYLQISLSLLLILAVIFQSVLQHQPLAQLIILVAALAFFTMLINMYLLIQTQQERPDLLNFRQWFGFYDVMFSFAVIVAGICCLLFDSNWPDILITTLMVFFLLDRSRRVFKKKTSFVVQ